MKAKSLLFISLVLSLTVSGQVQVNNHAPGDVKDEHGSANEYMHKTPVSDLVQHFERPEREDYQQPQKVLDYLGDIKGKTIVDIGAGSGYFTVKLAGAGANVIAADVDEEFQDHLRKRLDSLDLDNVEMRKIPYDSPGLQDGEVDIAFLVNTYHHIENRVDYFKKVRKGIKDDGYLLVVDFYKAELPVGPPVDHKISLDIVVTELKEAGYESIQVDVELLPYQYVVKAK